MKIEYLGMNFIPMTCSGPSTALLTVLMKAILIFDLLASLLSFGLFSWILTCTLYMDVGFLNATSGILFLMLAMKHIL